MACPGAKAAREQLIVDMTDIRAAVRAEPMGALFDSLPAVLTADPKAMSMILAGYLGTVLDKALAAIIALAGPCCGDCEGDGDD